MSNAFRGGLTVKIDDGEVGSAFIEVEEVQDLGGLGTSGGTIEVSHHKSTIREFIASLREGNEMTIACNKVQGSTTTQRNFMAACDAGEARPMEIQLTDGTNVETYTFTVLCLNYDLAPAWDDKNGIEFAVKINSQIAIADS